MAHDLRRALVTGLAGQDGGYLAEQLLAEGVEVHALVHADDPAVVLPDVVVHAGDLVAVEETRRLVADLAPDAVFNLAAISSVGESWERPDRTAAVNGLGAVALMESCLQAAQARDRRIAFVQASSAEIYGAAAVSPQNEQTPVRPLNPYGAAKAYAHLMVGVYRERGLGATSLVLYNHESPRRPHRFVTRKISSTVAAIATGGADRLELGNLEARRDWGWAPDYTDAMVRAARAAGEEDAADYVIATGESHSVRDFVAAAFVAAGIDDWEPLVSTEPALYRPTDPADLVGDAGRARAELGWRPTRTFDEIVAAMVEADLP